MKKCLKFPWCACGVALARELVETGTKMVIFNRMGGGIGRIPCSDLMTWATVEDVEDQYVLGCGRLEGNKEVD